jgi:hypothetical protein
VQAPVVTGQRRAEFAAGEERVEELHAVARHDAHPVAVTHTHRVAQPVCQPVGALVHLPVGQPPFGLLAGVDDGQTVGRV